MTSAAPGLWRLRALDPAGIVVWTALVHSARHPDGADVERDEQTAHDEIGDDALGYARLAADGSVERVELTARAYAGGPELWFAEVPEPDAAPPATCLLAMSGHGVEAGRVLDRAARAGIPVTSADQLAAVRWYPATGEVDQVYVAPAARRQGIGTALLLAAGIVAFARRQARLWGDGQRTSDGERLRASSVWAHLAAPLTHLAPPMTPPTDS